MTSGNVKKSTLVDGLSGVCLQDPTETILENLTKDQIARYVQAIQKATTCKDLNMEDLNILDVIDLLTYQHHGMCLKDSNVTYARLKACKKFGIKFIDRDDLMGHMNLMMPESI